MGGGDCVPQGDGAPCSPERLCPIVRRSYLVMPFMGTDLGKLMKHEKLSEDRVQFLVYQTLKGLKVGHGAAGLGGALRWLECGLLSRRPLTALCPHSTSTLLASSIG